MTKCPKCGQNGLAPRVDNCLHCGYAGPVYKPGNCPGSYKRADMRTYKRMESRRRNRYHSRISVTARCFQCSLRVRFTDGEICEAHDVPETVVSQHWLRSQHAKDIARWERDHSAA